MIVTFTPNPSVDRTVEVPVLVRGEVLRATGGRVDPGGKGVNVSRALAAAGRPTRTVLPCGGPEGDQLVALLEPEGVDVRGVRVSGSVRSNVSVVEPDGTVTKLNEPGPRLSVAEVAAVSSALRDAAEGAAWVVLCGSLPPGLADGLYADLVGPLQAAGARVAVDSSGAALRAALPAGPDVVKPNAEELAEAAGLAVHTVGDAVRAAQVLRDRGARTVLASLGADGALLVDDDGVVHGEARVDVPRSAVGAGDALLAGFLAAGGTGPAALAEALAWGAAATSLPGSRMPRPADLDRSRVSLSPVPDLARLLGGIPA